MTPPARRAFVTGGTRGIGRAISDRLEAEGWTVRRFSRSTGGDVRQPAAMRSAIEAFAREDATQPGLDLFVAAASASDAGYLHMLPDTALTRTIDTDFGGAVSGVQAALPWLMKKDGSTVVLISSMAAFHGVPGFAVYSAVKAAIRVFGDAMRLELAHQKPAILTLILGRMENEDGSETVTWTERGSAPRMPMKRFRIFASASEPTPLDVVVETLIDRLGHSEEIFLPASLEGMDWLARYTPRLFRLLMKLYHRRQQFSVR